MFQSTHPHGVRPPYSIHYDFLLPVSIHAPTRGATGRYLPSGNIQLSFNPRTHTRCDSLGGLLVEKRGVSIHAPTRGATLRGLITTRLHLMFQSTHPHEVRLLDQPPPIHEERVSIHAPTRGATFNYTNKKRARLCFNPRTHTRCDLFVSPYAKGSQYPFQSTHPHEVRPSFVRSKGTNPKGFNPRTHTRCDHSRVRFLLV